jgi:cytochrome c oxidase subunit 4
MSEHTSTAHAEHVLPMKTYWTVFWALMVLLVATVVGAYMPLGHFHLLMAMTIAVVKAALIIMYFMHVKYSGKITWVFSTAAFAWLAILILFCLNDYLSRNWLPGIEGK